MREFSVTLKEGLAKGLRPESYNPRNSQLFLSLLGLKPTTGGLVTIPLTTTSVGVTSTWPFPQLFYGSGQTLLAGSTTLQTVNTTTWAKTSVTVYLPNDSATTTITSGGAWHFVDFFDTWVLLNGSCVVYHTNERLARGLSDRTYAQTSMAITTGCAFKGQAVFGGFNPANYWSAAWQSFWSQWKAEADSGVSPTLNENTNFVCWGQIGGGDLLWPLALDDGTNGLVNDKGYDSTFPFIFEMMKNGQAGFMPMPWQGTVRCLKPLEKGIVVYCDNGIGFLYPAVVEDLPTFGFLKLSDVGICYRGAVGGDLRRHVFVTKDGSLGVITNDLNITTAYDEFFGAFKARTVAVGYNPILDEFHLSDNVKSYVFSPDTGLAEQAQILTSVASVNGVAEGVSATCATQATFSLTTDLFDFGNRGIKQVTWVEVSYTGLTSVYVSLQTSWTTTTPVLLNSEGTAFIGASGVDFRLVITGTGSASGKIDFITIRYKQSDKRFIRGI